MSILSLYNGYTQHNVTVYCAYLRHSSLALYMMHNNNYIHFTFTLYLSHIICEGENLNVMQIWLWMQITFTLMTKFNTIFLLYMCASYLHNYKCNINMVTMHICITFNNMINLMSSGISCNIYCHSNKWSSWWFLCAFTLSSVCQEWLLSKHINFIWIYITVIRNRYLEKTHLLHGHAVKYLTTYCYSFYYSVIIKIAQFDTIMLIFLYLHVFNIAYNGLCVTC